MIFSFKRHFTLTLLQCLLYSFVTTVLLNGCNTSTIAQPSHLPSNPSPSIVPSATYSSNPNHLSAAWVNDGGDKVVQSELRASRGLSVTNSLWTGQNIQLFGAKNEVVSFNLVLEASQQSAPSVQVAFNTLQGPNGSRITGAPKTSDAVNSDTVFDYTQRDIELFFVKYLKIQGLSKLGYGQYDERHIPQKLQRPQTNGVGVGGWTDRPNHDQSYPDIAVPLDLIPSFTVASGTNQSVWVDIYIPTGITNGVYQGAVTITEASQVSYQLPVSLTVYPFALPDQPSSHTMLNLGSSEVAKRYTGVTYPSDAATVAQVQLIRDRHFQMAHRHKISLIDDNTGANSTDRPSDEWLPRLDGSLFSAAKGYRGPGLLTGNGIFSVGTYGSWNWNSLGASGMTINSDAWGAWFKQYSPQTESFLYLIDESTNFAQIQSWANELHNAGRSLAGMTTLPLPSAVANTPTLDVVTSTMDVGDTNTWNNAVVAHKSDPRNRFYMYNGKRPGSGSFMIDDDGVALREVAWGQYKKGIDRWFYWDSTYYTDYQSGRGDIDVMNQAQTFGASASLDPVSGMTSGLYANGDGVLFYPGTDRSFPSSSLGLNGPVASLRLKHWRRGIQDVDYLTLAAAINPSATQTIVNTLVRSVLWENGVSDPADPTWTHCDIGWSTNPDDWEHARAQLAAIIAPGSAP